LGRSSGREVGVRGIPEECDLFLFVERGIRGSGEGPTQNGLSSAEERWGLGISM
jgi:hypothetical protein